MLDSLLKSNVDLLAQMVPDGAKIAVAKNQSGVPATLFRALARNKVRNLHVVGVPTSGYVTDLLIGSGAVDTVETSAVTLDEIGMAPRFIDAVKRGSIKMMDTTCPAVYSGLRAGEKGIPFIPIRGLIASDILTHRPDYRVIDNPFANGDPIVLVPAINPDIALVHVSLVDRYGNVHFGRDRDLALMAHAAKQTLVTAEAIYEGNLLEDALMAPATMSSIYVAGVAIAENGAWPQALLGAYPADYAHLRFYRGKAKTEQGFLDYVNQYVYARETSVA